MFCVLELCRSYYLLLLLLSLFLFVKFLDVFSLGQQEEPLALRHLVLLQLDLDRSLTGIIIASLTVTINLGLGGSQP